ncbi:MAG: Ig family protein [Candidatus Parcubacteria bacterium]|nr:Ig family protein [Candidatus Parcubacteria bacterium]
MNAMKTAEFRSLLRLVFAGLIFISAASRMFSQALVQPPDVQPEIAESELVNLSFRGCIDGRGHPDEQLVHVGFRVKGDGDYLLRTTGASLQYLGVTDYLKNRSESSVLASATFEIYDFPSSGSAQLVWRQIYTSGWDMKDEKSLVLFDKPKMESIYSKLGLFPQEKIDQECGMVFHASDGSHTMVIHGGGAIPEGVILAEVNLMPGSSSKLLNESARCFIKLGDRCAIAGFVIATKGKKGKPLTIMVRGAGPSMLKFGVPKVVQDPILTLHHGIRNPDGTSGDEVVGINDNWQDAPTNKSASVSMLRSATAEDFRRLGAFALDNGSKDAALVATLEPGTYSAVIQSKDGTEDKEGIVELYVMSDEPK